MLLTIYSGGAEGMDTHVEHLVWSSVCGVHPLTQPDLDTAIPMVTWVAFQLGRHLSHPITLQYLQRNYHVIKPASLVLALGYFDELCKHVLGGTGRCDHGSNLIETCV